MMKVKRNDYIAFPDFHDWTLTGLQFDGKSIRIRLSFYGRKECDLHIRDVSKLKIDIDEVQIVIADFNLERVTEENESRISEILDSYEFDNGPHELFFVSIDFHVGMNFVCLCKECLVENN